MEKDNCPFCCMDPSRIVAQSDLAVAFRDGFPVSPGHTLIVPRRHLADYFDLTEAEKAALWKMADQCKQMLDEELRPDGYNIGINIGPAAGQSVPHVHLHLIPRFDGDTPNPRGGVRGVIPAKQNY